LHLTDMGDVASLHMVITKGLRSWKEKSKGRRARDSGAKTARTNTFTNGYMSIYLYLYIYIFIYIVDYKGLRSWKEKSKGRRARDSGAKTARTNTFTNGYIYISICIYISIYLFILFIIRGCGVGKRSPRDAQELAAPKLREQTH